MRKAIALYSWGLDSTLAIMMMQKQWIEIIWLSFISLFWCKSEKETILENERNAKRFSFRLINQDFTKGQWEIIKHPVYGLWKRLNPCLDCHILMLKEAKKVMEAEWADFIITWEVLWQRPKSQRRDTFPIIDRDSWLEWLILRPLCAKKLKPTIPEQMWWVDREKLLDITWRWRKTQIEMAAWFNWPDFPAPAWWCLLTDVGHTNRMRDMVAKDEIPDEIDVRLISAWRHFNIWNAKVIVWRNEADNDKIYAIAWNDDILLQAEDFWSPIVIIRWEFDDSTIKEAAGITARYASTKWYKWLIKVKVFSKSWKIEIIETHKLDDAILRKKIVD